MYPDKAISGSTIRSTELGVRLMRQSPHCQLMTNDILPCHFLYFCFILLHLAQLSISDIPQLRMQMIYLDIKLNTCDP